MTHPEGSDLVRNRLALPGGQLTVLQPYDSADLPDDGPVEWAPLLPYWSVLWRSGLALARELSTADLAGLRVVELGCGLGVPSLVAARAGATVLATDADEEALDLLRQNAAENDLELTALRAEWADGDALAALAPFDLVLAADVLYEHASAEALHSLIERLGPEVWLADPGRPAAGAFVKRARRRWSVATSVRDDVEIHRLRSRS